MEAFRDRFIEAELLLYKEVLFEEATEEGYAQHDPVDREECNCIRLAEHWSQRLGVLKGSQIGPMHFP